MPSPTVSTAYSKACADAKKGRGSTFAHGGAAQGAAAALAGAGALPDLHNLRTLAGSRIAFQNNVGIRSCSTNGAKRCSGRSRTW